jgi:hypothetical protein
MSALITDKSTRRLIIIAPGIQKAVADAVIKSLKKQSNKAVKVILDCNEDVCRLGYGDIEAIKILQDAGLDIRHVAGLRAGVLVCDDDAWIFTPTALYVQDEIQSDETPNAMHLNKDMADMIAISTSEEERLKASDGQADIPGELELGSFSLTREQTATIEKSLKQIPPLPFDIARQVRVFEAYLQYVEITLDGCHLQHHKVNIPDEIVGLGADDDIVKRIHTTFDLITRDSDISSAELNEKLRQIREQFTPSLGKPWGRAILKWQRKEFDEAIASLEQELCFYKETVYEKIQDLMWKSIDDLIRFYVPRVIDNPPAVLKRRGNVTVDIAETWLRMIFESSLPEPEKLISKMKLEVTFRDVTYDTLQEPDFQERVRLAFPNKIDWDKPFKEFNAAKEKKPQSDVLKA